MFLSLHIDIMHVCMNIHQKNLGVFFWMFQANFHLTCIVFLFTSYAFHDFQKNINYQREIQALENLNRTSDFMCLMVST